VRSNADEMASLIWRTAQKGKNKEKLKTKEKAPKTKDKLK